MTATKHEVRYEAVKNGGGVRIDGQYRVHSRRTGELLGTVKRLDEFTYTAWAAVTPDNRELRVAGNTRALAAAALLRDHRIRSPRRAGR